MKFILEQKIVWPDCGVKFGSTGTLFCFILATIGIQSYAQRTRGNSVDACQVAEFVEPRLHIPNTRLQDINSRFRRNADVAFIHRDARFHIAQTSYGIYLRKLLPKGVLVDIAFKLKELSLFCIPLRILCLGGPGPNRFGHKGYRRLRL